MLYKLGQQEKFTPVKYFSIDRVFRNETLDATHLAEFHQIEGVVADFNLTLGDLMGLLHEFFSKMGKGLLECEFCWLVPCGTFERHLDMSSPRCVDLLASWNG